MEPRRPVIAFALLLMVACGSSSAPSSADAGQPSQGDAAADGASAASLCAFATALSLPADPSAKGPWPVGAKSTTIHGLLTEIWYPATVGSDSGKTPISYDVRQDLPPDQAAKISDADNPLQPCDCFRDLPIDGAHGPYPLVVFIHGTAGFKTQNLDNLVHWASRGFVVMAADHPGLSIGSFVGSGTMPQPNLPADVQSEIAAIEAASGDLAIFAQRVDPNRIGLAGHSAGGNGVAGMGAMAGVKVIIPISANAATTGASVTSSLYVGGTADNVVPFTSVTSAYTKTDARAHKRLVGIAGAGHTGVTSLCGIRNSNGQSIVDVAKADGVLTGLLSTFADDLFDCASNTTPQAEVIPIVDDATSAVLEETLWCNASTPPAIDGIQAAFPQAQTYERAP